MKKATLILSIITLVNLVNSSPINAQIKEKAHVQENVSVQRIDVQFSTKLNLIELKCNATNAKVLGENIKIELIPDGIKLTNAVNKSLYKDNIWYINQSYDFLDFLKVRIWDVNLFKDNLIADIVIDRASGYKFLTIPIQKEQMQFELVINTEKGLPYRDMVLKLRQDYERIIYENQIEIKKLNSEVSSLKYQNENLTKKLKK